MKKSDQEALRKLIKNYNAKISYHKKRNPQISELLPEKIYKKDLIVTGKKTENYKKQTQFMKRFLERGSTKQSGQSLKIWVDEYKRAQKAANRKRAQSKKRVNFPDNKMGEIQANRYRPLKDKSSELSHSQLRRSTAAMQQSLMKGREDVYKSHYIKGVTNVIGDNTVILKVVQQMSGQDIYDMYVADDRLKLDFVYDVNQELKTREEEIASKIAEYLRDNNKVVYLDSESAQKMSELVSEYEISSEFDKIFIGR